jgi:hypothetical protein
MGRMEIGPRLDLTANARLQLLAKATGGASRDKIQTGPSGWSTVLASENAKSKIVKIVDFSPY